jgi:hypothetical protein
VYVCVCVCVVSSDLNIKFNNMFLCDFSHLSFSLTSLKIISLSKMLLFVDVAS